MAPTHFIRTFNRLLGNADKTHELPMLIRKLHSLRSLLFQTQRSSAESRDATIQVSRRLDELKVLQAAALVSQRADRAFEEISHAEFKVFSQFGDDGIIQYVTREAKLESTHRTFVEFGVENYQEANTRFLLIHGNWRGLVIDGSERNVAAIRAEDLYWRHDLTALSAFITKDNIDELITGAGFAGEIGLLSIDIDGNDYWVWKAMKSVNPVVVVAEYNAVFGADRAVTIPYQPDFFRTKAHHSNLYFGASLQALCRLAKQKGYSFVGCNSSGNNCYFVRNDRLGRLKAIPPEQGFRPALFRESRNERGEPTFLSGAARLEVIADLSLHDVDADRTIRVADLISR